MPLKFIIFSFLLIFSSILYANETTQGLEKEEELSYLDSAHESISDMVIDLSDSIDNGMNFMSDEDDKPVAYHDDTSVDSFFQNRKFLEETSNTYIRIRTRGTLESKESEDADVKVRAQVPLSRTVKSLKLFVDSFSEDDPNDMTTHERENEADNKTMPDVGLSYYNPKRYGIQSKFKLGMSSWTPYIQARFNRVFQAGEWSIEPVQTFRYSTEDVFLEDTTVYFDTPVTDTSLLRFEMLRYTETDVDGMSYGFGATYFETINAKTGLSFSQGFGGNTKYRYVEDESTDLLSSSFGGINNYSTSVNWRQNVWKKWFFYELNTGVNFHRQYDYEANYSVRLSLDIYFGRFGKK